MLKFAIHRGLRGIIALITFQTFLFFLIRALPYDFSAFLFANPTYRDYVQSRLGLNQPLWAQYSQWMWGFFHLDLGQSFLAWPTPVSELLLQRAPKTLTLFLLAALLAYTLGIWLGKQIAWHRSGPLEAGITLAGVASYTSFAPFLAFLLINVFGRELGWLPYQRLADPNVWIAAEVGIDWILLRLGITLFALMLGSLAISRATQDLRTHWQRRSLRWGGWVLLIATAILLWQRSDYSPLLWDVLEHMLLPLISVILLSFGETMLLMRTTMLETISDEYVLTARAKGLPAAVIRDRHVARNAFLPVLTRLLLNLPLVLTGSLAIELVFRWQAMGELIFLAIDYQDIPLLLGILSIVGVLTLAGHILLDILHVYLDPHLRYTTIG